MNGATIQKASRRRSFRDGLPRPTTTFLRCVPCDYSGTQGVLQSAFDRPRDLLSIGARFIIGTGPQIIFAAGEPRRARNAALV